MLSFDFSCSYVMFWFRGLQKEEVVLLTHGDSVDKVADGFKVVAQSGNVIAGIYFPHHFVFPSWRTCQQNIDQMCQKSIFV